MKLIFNNMYVQLFRFDSLNKFSSFIKQDDIDNVSLDETSGDYYYSYVFYDSLSKKKLYSVYFLSDENDPKNLYLLIWQAKKVFGFHTGHKLFLLDELHNVIGSTNLLCPLVGLYVTAGQNLLILEEAAFKVVNSVGEILKEEQVDFINNFELKDQFLMLNTDGGKRVFDLRHL